MRFMSGLCLLVLISTSSCVLKSKTQALKAPANLKAPVNMILLSGGTFEMGYNHGEPHEHPQHEVSISPFLIDRTEVTNANYGACVSANVCRPSPFAQDNIFGRPSHPVVGIPWREALRYCKWAGKRLPSEAEWEYAARAPSFSYYPWAKEFDSARANVKGRADGYEKSAPVGTFKTGDTPTKIADLSGNVAEWTSDWFDSTYYQRSTKNNPRGPERATGERVVRGGSWADTPYQVRSTSRSAMDPERATDSVGFRCALSKK